MPDKNIDFAISSESKEWYTPGRYIEAARRVMGGIDLDPASCELAQRTVQATHYFTEETNGLAHDWQGRVWLNPPYGRIPGIGSSAAHWTNYLIGQWRFGNVTQAILLVNANIGDKWFMRLFEWPICFVNRRISFIEPPERQAKREKKGRAKESPTKGNAFVYFGNNIKEFVKEFSQFGVVVSPSIGEKASELLLEALIANMAWIGPPPIDKYSYDSARENAWELGKKAIDYWEKRPVQRILKEEL